MKVKCMLLDIHLTDVVQDGMCYIDQGTRVTKSHQGQQVHITPNNFEFSPVLHD